MAGEEDKDLPVQDEFNRLASQVREQHFQLSQKVVQLETLYQAGLSLSHSLQTEAVAGEFLQLAVGIVDARGGFLVLKQEHQSRLELVQHTNLDDTQVQVLRQPRVRNRLARGLKSGRPLHLAPGALPDSLAESHLLAVLIGNLGFIGVVDKESRRGVQAFAEEDAHLLELMGQQAGAALANARLYRGIVEEKNLTQNVLASIGNGVISTDLRGRIVQVNPAVEQLFEGESQLRGRSCVRLFQRYGCKALAQAVANCLKDGRSRRLDGEHLGGEVVLNAHLNPLRTPQGEVEGLVVALENLTNETRIRTMFKQYASDQVVDLLLASATGPALGGEQREVTILFVDIRGSTSLLEKIGAEEMVAVLNNCFTRLVEVVLRYQGTLDKYTGDGFMVVFGAPVSLPDDSERAACTALEIRAEMERFNRSNRVGLGLGIGLSRGVVVAGNIGALRRMEYTVIGPKVVLASRLCDRARAGEIWVDGAVHTAIKGRFAFQALGRHSFKGTGTPVEVYELVGPKGTTLKEDRKGPAVAGKTEPHLVSLSVPMVAQMEVVAAKVAAATAEFMGLDGDKVEEIRLALIEACINAFEHSQSKDRRLELQFTLAPEELRLQIADRGQGFDVEVARRLQRERRARGERHRGWGLTLMEGLMDEVQVQSDVNGTCVTMVKRR